MSQVLRSGGRVTAALVVLLAGAGAHAQDGAMQPLAPNVVAAEVDEATVTHPATRLLEVRVEGGSPSDARVELVTDGAVGTYELLELTSPPRLALDLHGVRSAPKAPQVESGSAVRSVRFGKHGEKLRVVLDAGNVASMPAYRVERTKRGLVVSLGERTAAREVAPKPTAKPVAAKAPAKLAAAPNKVAAQPKAAAPTKSSAATPGAKVLDLTFSETAQSQLVEVALTRASKFEVSRPEPSTVVLTLQGVDLPRKLERSLDTSAFEGPVRTVSSFVDPTDGQVRIVVALARPAADAVRFSGSKLRWTFTEEASAEVIDEATGTTRTAGHAEDAASFALETAKSAKGYKGRRVSFEFKEIDIHNLFRVIAEVSKRNLVLSDDVKGKITIRLRNVPWDQALDLILKTKGLGKEETGNIIRIAPLKQLELERKAQADAMLARENAQPLKVRIIPVNYALAGEISPKVKDLLSKRGSITVDQRTNTLIVKDIAENLAKAEGLVRSLDSQTPQVLIAARIVEASSNFTRSLGVQWGGNLSATSGTANTTGLAFPNEAAARGAVPGVFGGGFGVPATPNWAVSFPAPVADNQGAGVGFSFGSAGGAAILNMRLTALETEGVIKTVSAPKVTTLDNKEALIGQGVSIPFSQVSASGVNTVFVEAKLELRVTPHVTSDGSVLLQIRATNNQPNDQLTGANGQPSITKREAETEVLVADGDTTVIGGIYTRKASESVSQVPLLGNIPVLGWLFKSSDNRDERTELLVFISPSIVNREASVVAGG